MNRRFLQSLSALTSLPNAAISHLTDQQLLQQFAERNDHEAFTELVRRNGPMVISVCRQLLTHHADTEDGVQATFLALIQSAKTLPKSSNPGAWLYGVAVRVSAKIRRSAVRRKQREERSAVPDASQPVPDSAWSEWYATVHKQILALPESQRNAFILCEIQNVPAAVAARQLGCSTNALSSRLVKARHRLLAQLAKAGIAPTVAAGLIGIGSANSAIMTCTEFAKLIALPTLDPQSLPVHITKIIAGVTLMNTIRNKVLIGFVSILTTSLVLSATAITWSKTNPSNAYDQPAANTAPATECVVSGTVYMPDGQPAANATVYANGYIYTYKSSQQIKTDQTGQYQFRLKLGWYSFAALSGKWGGESKSNNYHLFENTPTLNLDFHLAEQGVLKGKLLEAETGKPIVAGRFHLDNGFEATSDSKGEFEIQGLTTRQYTGYVVAANRYRQIISFDKTEKPISELDLRVPRGSTFAGHVTDQNGKPIIDAILSYKNLTSEKVYYQYCEADGSFVYEGASPQDPVELTVSATGYRSEVIKPLITTFEKTTELNIKLNRVDPKSNTDEKNESKEYVTGTVRDPNGKPFANVPVRWRNMYYRDLPETKTDKKGRFQLEIKQGSKLLVISPMNCSPIMKDYSEGAEKHFDVQAEAGHTAKGKIVDEDGNALANILIQGNVTLPQHSNLDIELSGPSIYTDSNGRFEIKGIPQGMKFTCSNASWLYPQKIEMKYDGLENNIVMKTKEGALKGRVIDANGKPVRNFRVFINFGTSPELAVFPLMIENAYYKFGLHYSSNDGTFALSRIIANCPYDIRVMTDEQGGAVAKDIKAVPLKQIKTSAETVLQLTPPMNLKVNIRDENEQPIPGAILTLINNESNAGTYKYWENDEMSGGIVRKQQTQKNGTAEFKNVIDLKARLFVQAPGKARCAIPWNDRAPEITVTMKPQSVIKAKIDYPRDKATKGFRVHFRNQDQSQAKMLGEINVSVEHQQDGSFTVDQLPPGKWTAIIGQADNGRQYVFCTVETEPGKTTEWNYKWVFRKDAE